MNDHALGQPMNSPSLEELLPLPAPKSGWVEPEFTAKQKRQQQFVADKLRQIGVAAHQPGGAKICYSIVDSILAEIHRASVNVPDLHLQDAGVPEGLAHSLSKHRIHTLGDLANCNPSRLMLQPAPLNIMEIVRVLRLALRASVQFQTAD